jgi:hypothetical protein
MMAQLHEVFEGRKGLNAICTLEYNSRWIVEVTTIWIDVYMAFGYFFCLN